ncbi:type III-A CRISPR-associated RAMP protein Csm3 [Acidiplasma aeolicum]|uniref:type III-A CRISPR-associated RAMP protein Csm3 n=1 Tax=Acidiplasma aeolicum TaxID=507754 RepID=UPI0037195C0E
MDKWEYNIVFKLDIETKTGLHIGGSNEELKIGGTDNPVITTEYNYKGEFIELPYLPGSSIKGKIRSLLEAVSPQNDRNIIDKMFGYKSDSKEEEDRRTRLIIRDAFLSDDDIEKYKNNELRITEIKGENTIDPLTSRANPRFIERIIPGIHFTTNIIIMKYENDNENDMKRILNEGINLLEDSYLGGNGTRGYGVVSLKLEEDQVKRFDYYEGNGNGSV